MKITVEGADEEFAEKLVVLAAEHSAELTITTVGTGWTVDRAEHYLRSLTAGARQFAEVVVAGDGYAAAETLRSILGRLNGPAVALTRAVPRGVKAGWWPDGTAPPITVEYDPDNPSWQKAIAYRMTSENVPVFREAITRMAAARSTAEILGMLHPGGLEKTVGAANFAVPGVNLVDLDGGSRPADDENEDTV